MNVKKSLRELALDQLNSIDPSKKVTVDEKNKMAKLNTADLNANQVETLTDLASKVKDLFVKRSGKGLTIIIEL